MSRRGVAMALLGCVVLVGCARAPEGEPQPAASTPPAAQSPAPDDTRDEPGRPGEPMEDLTGAEQNPREVAPTWDAAAQQAAEERALTFMRAFARPHLSDAEWHAGIAGLMTPQGAELFAYVDPANVPPTSADEATALPNESASLAEVHVATDAGTYLVTLTRTSQASPWLVEYTEPAA